LQRERARRETTAPRPEPNRWLLMALQLPARPSNGRVKTWRRLQQLGAMQVKGSLYVLPNSAHAFEDFEWLRVEIEALQGQAHVFAASAVGGVTDQQLIDQFQAARDADYRRLLKDLRAAQSKVRRLPGDERARAVRSLGDKLDKVRAIDFFAAPQGEAAQREYASLARSLEPARRDASQPTPGSLLDHADYQQRTWVTRPRPGVDRLGSAWLISRFIDRRPTFEFADDADRLPDAIPFDMFSGGFGHEGERCTFEVLQAKFGITDPAVSALAEIVHDLDLKEERYRPPQAAGVATLIDGLRLAFGNDAELLTQGVALFEAMYRGLQSSSTPRPRRARILRTPGGAK
jgi:hypothetical protein